MRRFLLLLPLAALLAAQPKITSPRDFLGFNIGDDYMMASYTQLDAYWHKIEKECDRCKLVRIIEMLVAALLCCRDYLR